MSDKSVVVYHSSPFREAEEIAKIADASYSAYNFHPDEWVLLLHEEGTQLLYRSAFLKLWKDYVLVFTEHHRTHVYHRTDLAHFSHFKEQEPSRLTGTGAVDKCFECKKDMFVDDLLYKRHPGQWQNDSIIPFCQECYDKLENEDI